MKRTGLLKSAYSIRFLVLYAFSGEKGYGRSFETKHTSLMLWINISSWELSMLFISPGGSPSENLPVKPC